MTLISVKNLSEKEILILYNLVSDDCDESITPPLRVGSCWSSWWGGVKRCCLRPQVKWCCGKVHPAHRHHLAMEPATPDASEPVRGGKETRRGRGEPGGRPSRCLMMSFSLVAEGRGDGCGNGGLQIRLDAPVNWPENARQLRLMSLPTQMNATPQRSEQCY